MRRITKILLALGATVLLALGWVVFKPENEPAYQGKKLSEWIKAFYSVGTQVQAEEAIRKIGTNAVPLLVHWIAYEPSRNRIFEFIDGLLGKLGSEWHRDVELRARQRDAETAFQILGPAAESAIPALSQYLYAVKDDEEVRAIRLAFALAQLGPKHCAPLCAALTNQNSIVRAAAARALSERRDTNYVPAIPSLIACIHQPESDCRFRAIHALGSLHFRPELSLPALNLMLTNRDPLFRSAAVEAVGQFESEARTNLQFVLPLLHDADPKVREAATNAIRKIDSSAPPK